MVYDYEIGVITKRGASYIIRGDETGFIATDNSNEERYRLNEKEISPVTLFTGNQLNPCNDWITGGKTIEDVVDTITGVKKLF